MSTLRQLLAEQQLVARDQLAAAWQLHVSRVEEQLGAGWQAHISRVFDERFDDLAKRLEDEVEARVAAALREERGAVERQARADTRSQVSHEFNRTARGLRQAQSAPEVLAALLESAIAANLPALLLVVEQDTLRGMLGRGIAGLRTDMAGGIHVLRVDAPAVAAALESLDPVVAGADSRELSEPVARFFAAESAARVYLFPVSVGEKGVAVVCVGETAEVAPEASALELFANLAGARLEALGASRKAAPGERAAIAGAASHKEPRPASVDWTALSPLEQDLHLRAQRFARVRVAELRLYHAAAVKSGRARRDLYRELKTEVDTGREAFQRQFILATSSMIDYFHLELVRTLANDDVSLLGPEYPGPLV